MASAPVTLGSTKATRASIPGCDVVELRFPPKLRLARHDHSRPTVAVVLQGGFDGQLGGRATECRSLGTRVEPAGEPHTNTFGWDGARILVLQPDPMSPELPTAVRRWLGAPMEARQPELVGLACNLVAELNHPDDLTPLALEGHTLALLAKGARLAVCDERSRPQWMAHVEELLHDRFTQHLTLAEVATSVGVHRMHVARTFRAHHGTSIATYVRRLRVDLAMRRLTTTHDPIAAIAVEAGFSDQSHLTREFRRVTGVTPGRFRAYTGPD